MAEPVSQPCAQHQQPAEEHRVPGRDEARDASHLAATYPVAAAKPGFPALRTRVPRA